jgi:hypothetical protein
VTARLKVALAGGAAVVASTALGAAVLRSWIARDTEARVVDAVRRASQLAERSHRLRAFERAERAASLAADGEFAALFSLVPTERAAAAFVAIEGNNARLGKQGRRADLLLVVGADGKVLARDSDPRALFGEDLAARHPVIAAALRGEAGADVWLFDGKLLHVSASPVRPAEEVLGAVVLGTGFSTRDARAEAGVLGADVAYFFDGRVFASSLAVPGSVGEGGDAAEDVERVSAVAAALLATGRGSGGGEAARDPAPLEIELPDRRPERYVAAVAELGPSARAGVIVLSSVTGPVREAQRMGRLLLAVGLVAWLVLVVSLMRLGQYFERRLDQIEIGVSDVISGNVDATFQAFDEFEGLCNGLNVMIARLLGRPEPGATTTIDETAVAAADEGKPEPEPPVAES